MNLDAATELCKRYEGFRSRPYLCPAGVPTIGYGSTRYVGGALVTLQDPPISEQAARAMLTHELHHVFAPAVARLCPKLFADAVRTGVWHRFNAIVDFTYNLGAGRLQISTLRKRVNADDWDGVCVELMKWTRGGGKVLPGLIARRKAECDLINRV